MSSGPSLSHQVATTIVVPCYNEERRLPVSAFEEFLRDPRTQGISFLFVNDGSKDNTQSILEGMQKAFPDRVGVLHQVPNRGKAEAVRNGMLQVIAEGKSAITGFWDADLATPLDQIEPLLANVLTQPDVDMVFGSRVKLLGRHIERQPLRHYLGRIFATAASAVLRLPIYDTQCGAKLFRVSPVLSKVLAEPFQSRWIFDVEIVARYIGAYGGDPANLRDKIVEYPLMCWRDVAGSKLTPMDFVKAFGELIAIRQRYLA